MNDNSIDQIGALLDSGDKYSPKAREVVLFTCEQTIRKREVLASRAEARRC